MESIINAMNTLIDNLAVVKVAIDSQEAEAGDELAGLAEQMDASFQLAVAIRDTMKRIEATPQETAELIAGAAREVFREPLEEEETDEQSNRQE